MGCVSVKLGEDHYWQKHQIQNKHHLLGIKQVDVFSYF